MGNDYGAYGPQFLTLWLIALALIGISLILALRRRFVTSLCISGAAVTILTLGIGSLPAIYHGYFDHSFHLTLTQIIIQDGAVPAEFGSPSVYTRTPGMHLVAATLIEVTGLPIREGFDVTVTIAGPLLTLVASFLLARDWFGDQVAAVTAALLAGTRFFLAWSTTLSATTFAIGLFAISLYFLLRRAETNRTALLALQILMAVGILVSHSLTMVALVLIAGLVGVVHVVWYARLEHRWTARPLGIATVFGFLFAGYLVYRFPDIFAYALRQLLLEIGLIEQASRISERPMPLIEPTLTLLERGLRIGDLPPLLTLWAVGMAFMYRELRVRGRWEPKGLAIFLISISLWVAFATNFLPSTPLTDVLLPFRWVVYAAPVALPIAVSGLLLVTGRSKRTQVVAVLLILLPIVALSSATAYPDANPFIQDKTGTPNRGFTPAEVASLDWIDRLGDGERMLSDSYFAAILKLRGETAEVLVVDAQSGGIIGSPLGQEIAAPELEIDYLIPLRLSENEERGLSLQTARFDRVIARPEPAELAADTSATYSNGAVIILVGRLSDIQGAPG